MSITRGSIQFSKRFKAACAAEGKTISAWAKEAGCTPQAISQFATGVRYSENYFSQMKDFVESYELNIKTKKAG